MDFLGNGLGPQNLGSPGAGSLVSFPLETYLSPLLDLSAATLNIELVPAKPWHFPICYIRNWLIETALGAQVTPPTVQAGSDSAHSNFIPSTNTTPTNVNFAACVGQTPQFKAGPSNVNAILTSMRIPNAPVLMDITAGGAGTGGYVLRAKLVCQVLWVAVS